MNPGRHATEYDFNTRGRKLQDTWPRMVASSLWKIGARHQQVLGGPESPLDVPKLLVAQQSPPRVQIGIGAIEPRYYRPIADRLEVAAYCR
jgi:hypothetical protein